MKECWKKTKNREAGLKRGGHGKGPLKPQNKGNMSFWRRMYHKELLLYISSCKLKHTTLSSLLHSQHNWPVFHHIIEAQNPPVQLLIASRNQRRLVAWLLENIAKYWISTHCEKILNKTAIYLLGLGLYTLRPETLWTFTLFCYCP